MFCFTNITTKFIDNNSICGVIMYIYIKYYNIKWNLANNCDDEGNNPLLKVSTSLRS